MDTQRARKRRPVQPYPELEDESWQPPAGVDADPERTAVLAERTRVLRRALAQITDDQRTAIVLFDVEGYDYARDRRHDRRLARHRQVADPSRAPRAAGPPRGPDGAVPWLTRHEDHDLGLVVALADGELSGEELATAEGLVASCPDCAALVLDLRALTVADRSMATPERPRDFRLTPADAARLALAVGTGRERRPSRRVR